ncbi:uncharacterized protein [Lolium perenne]|uniref:uncharacterized protein n=1 Tax=Lolium perenne TaxID=4522 RepID=UPI003A997CCE
MDSDDEEALAALMDEEVTVATTVRDAIGDKEQLPILVALLAMITDEDKTRIAIQDERELFLKIGENLREIDYFKLKRDVVSLLGFCTMQKYKVTLRMLAYGILGDTQDDYLRMTESIAIDCMHMFCRAIVVIFGKNYLHTLNAEDTTRILAQNTDMGFSGMLGSIDCMCSNVFQKDVEGTAPPVQFEINGHQYDKGYYLVDGIYPRWSTFLKTLSNSVPGGKKVWFA